MIAWFCSRPILNQLATVHCVIVDDDDSDAFKRSGQTHCHYIADGSAAHKM